MARVHVLARLPMEPANNVWFNIVVGDPAADGLAAGVGSYAMRTDLGQTVIYKKTDVADDAWTLPFGVDLNGVAVTTGLERSPNAVCRLEGDGDPADNDLTVTAVLPGLAGNGITVAVVQATDPDVALSVVVDGLAITITLPTDGAGDPDPATADDVKAAWDASDALDLATIAVEGDGTGEVAEVDSGDPQALEDGLDGTGGAGVAGPGSEYTDYDGAKKWVNVGTAAAPEWSRLAFFSEI